MVTEKDKIGSFIINLLCQVRVANQTALRAQARRVDELHTKISQEQNA